MTKSERERRRLDTVCSYIYGPRWQADLARDLKLNERTVRAWVAGQYRVSPAVWAKIAERLNRKLRRAPVMLQIIERHIATLEA